MSKTDFLMAQFNAEAKSYYWAISNHRSEQFITDRKLRMCEIGKALSELVGEKEAGRLIMNALVRAELQQSWDDLQDTPSYFERYLDLKKLNEQA